MRSELLARLDLLLTEEETRIEAFLDSTHASEVDTAENLQNHLESLDRLKRTAFGN
jgi:hypothetical protein